MKGRVRILYMIIADITDDNSAKGSRRPEQMSS